jgi:hypothetical protein
VQLPALGEEVLAETASGATPAAVNDSPAGRAARRVSRQSGDNHQIKVAI